MNCEACRVELMLVAIDGVRDFLTCPNCGVVQAAEPPAEFVVSVVWRAGRPSAPEVAALRRLCPEIAYVPVRVLWPMMRRLRRWESGVYFLGEARDLQRRGRALGLQIELIPF